MIISTGIDNGWPNNELIMRWREKNELGNWIRKEKFVEDFYPYVYINPEKAKIKSKKLPIDPSVLEDYIEHEYFGATVEKVTGAVTANKEPLWKVQFTSPNMVKKFCREISGTCEGDVPYEDRYLVDNVESLPEYEPRKVFIDLEALQYSRQSGGPKQIRKNNAVWADWQMINVIGCYDNYTNKYVLWTQHPECGQHLPSLTHIRNQKMMNFDEIDVEIRDFPNEFSMLNDFVEWIDVIDPDILLAWGMGFYDLPTLVARLESTGVGARKLSPSSLGKNRYVDPTPHWTAHKYKWTTQPIRGRIVVSLDRLFERVYRDSKSTNLPSNKLDIVGQKLFGRGKTEFRPDFYDQDYHLFLENYLYYNFRDVLLMVDIEEKYNLINGQMALQNLAMCKFDSTFYGSSYARVYFMRKADFKQKTGWYAKNDDSDEDDKLTGAIVLDPEELDSVGLHKNVAILDFAGLYPSIMISYNASHETKIRPGEESDDDIIGDGCRFKRNPIGLLPASVIELDVLRDEYKLKRDKAGEKHGKTSNEFRKWDDAQKTVKRLRATFYGLMAFKGYSWGDMDIARTITKGGRDALKSIINASEDLGYKVIYGHTDSIFVCMGDDLSTEECVEKAKELGVYLTHLMQEELQSEAMIVDCEMLMDRFYLPRRNRYGGRVVWMPEVGFKIANEAVEDRMKIQGLEAKHANTSVVGRNAQLGALFDIWADKSPEQVKQGLMKHIEEVRTGGYDTADLLSRARLGKWLPTKKGLLATASMMTMNRLDNRGKEVKIGGKFVKDEMEVTSLHYGDGATNPEADPYSKGDNASYANLLANGRAAAWHNIVLANDEYQKLDKGDSFYMTFLRNGPTWIPEGGYAAFHDLEQIKSYEIDVEMVIEKHIISKLDHIMYGLGMSNDELRPHPKKLVMGDFFE